VTVLRVDLWWTSSSTWDFGVNTLTLSLWVR